MILSESESGDDPTHVRGSADVSRIVT